MVCCLLLWGLGDDSGVPLDNRLAGQPLGFRSTLTRKKKKTSSRSGHRAASRKKAGVCVRNGTGRNGLRRDKRIGTKRGGMEHDGAKSGAATISEECRGMDGGAGEIVFRSSLSRAHQLGTEHLCYSSSPRVMSYMGWMVCLGWQR